MVILVDFFLLFSALLNCNAVSIEEQMEHIARKKYEALGLGMAPERRSLNFDGVGTILGAPTRLEHLPPGEPLLPGHALINPAFGMLKSALKFPHKEQENGAGVYGNLNNLGINYQGRNERVLYSGFRKKYSDEESESDDEQTEDKLDEQLNSLQDRNFAHAVKNLRRDDAKVENGKSEQPVNDYVTKMNKVDDKETQKEIMNVEKIPTSEKGAENVFAVPSILNNLLQVTNEHKSKIASWALVLMMTGNNSSPEFLESKKIVSPDALVNQKVDGKGNPFYEEAVAPSDPPFVMMVPNAPNEKERVTPIVPVYEERVTVNDPVYEEKVALNAPVYEERVVPYVLEDKVSLNTIYDEKGGLNVPIYKTNIALHAPINEESILPNVPIYEEKVALNNPVFEERNSPVYEERVVLNAPEETVALNSPIYEEKAAPNVSKVKDKAALNPEKAIRQWWYFSEVLHHPHDR